MKRVGNLFDRLCEYQALEAAARRAARGKGGRLEVGRFFFRLESELLSLQADLLSESYCPGAYRCFRIRDPKERTICAAPFRDRVLQHALCAVLEPVFERGYIHDSYACRVGRGSHRALQRAQQYARRQAYFLKLDIRQFFHSIDHGILKARIARKVKDPRVLALVARVIDHPAPGLASGKGLPIGNLCSQHFANLYLDPLDHRIKEDLRLPGYLRYMDDMLLFAADRRTLRVAAEELEPWLAGSLALGLKPAATLLAPVREGIPFLGFRVFPGLIRVRAENWRRFRIRLRRRLRELAAGEIAEARFLASLQSQFGHLEQGNTRTLRARLLPAE